MHRAQASMRIELFDVGDAERLREALEVRFEVFVEEQRVPRDEEVDAHDLVDAQAVHALARDESGRAIGAGRLYRASDGSAKIGRMAVRRSERGCGVGAALLEALIAAARSRGFTRATLDAQVHAIGFYMKAGFTPYGERIIDAGILHQPMESGPGCT
jgi:predicted GNAT family N-acyltransferase